MRNHSNDVSLEIFQTWFHYHPREMEQGSQRFLTCRYPLTSGSIRNHGRGCSIFHLKKRDNHLSRVFQDLRWAPRMTVAENLLIAKFRGEERGLLPRRLSSHRRVSDYHWKNGNGRKASESRLSFFQVDNVRPWSLDGYHKTTKDCSCWMNTQPLTQRPVLPWWS